MKSWFKKISIPSGDKTEVVAYNSWIVRWLSVKFDDSTLLYTKQQSEIFPSEIDANKFADQLVEAMKLLRCTGKLDVKIECNQNKLATLANS